MIRIVCCVLCVARCAVSVNRNAVSSTQYVLRKAHAQAHAQAHAHAHAKTHAQTHDHANMQLARTHTRKYQFMYTRIRMHAWVSAYMHMRIRMPHACLRTRTCSICKRPMLLQHYSFAWAHLRMHVHAVTYAHACLSACARMWFERARAHACMHTRTHIRMYACLSAYARMFKYARTHACLYAVMHARCAVRVTHYGSPVRVITN